jgi:hypothetical protein
MADNSKWGKMAERVFFQTAWDRYWPEISRRVVPSVDPNQGESQDRGRAKLLHLYCVVNVDLKSNVSVTKPEDLG